MQTIQRLAVTSTLVLGALSLTACSSMSTRDRYTAGGAAVGGVAGNVISGGSTAGTVGGAVVGGVVGNQVGKNKERDRRCTEMSC
jgi:osmotically inducible lipoprotein OsmB